MLKLKLQYSHLMQRTDSVEKTLMLRKTENKGRSGQEKMRWLDNITVHESDQTLGDSGGQSDRNKIGQL